jgi:hypothetical protein
VTGFGTAALDVDNDGRLDLFAANGHVDDRPWINHPMAQLPHLYRASSPGTFMLVVPSGSPYFARSVVGRGVAAGDLDNDGRVDLVIVHRDQPVALLRNTTPGGHWLGLSLTGTRSANPRHLPRRGANGRPLAHERHELSRGERSQALVRPRSLPKDRPAGGALAFGCRPVLE